MTNCIALMRSAKFTMSMTVSACHSGTGRHKDF